MFTWKAIYLCKDSRGSTKRMQYYVSAPTAGDVPEIIRSEMAFDDENITVDEVEIHKVTGRGVICSREL